ncbi:calcium-binding protein [Planotetraspora silvatica]|uniref:calcium-binding protein n=1 Tax=Planotetraspora silvatica TaxID=234614 RepID=UPI001951A74A|nr:hypothetical protein [Planotetraspora silvatica]
MTNLKTGETKTVPGLSLGLNENGTQVVYRTPCAQGYSCRINAMDLTTGAVTWSVASDVRDTQDAIPDGQGNNATFDGVRTVVFHSMATDLVPGVTTPGDRMYVHDLVSGVTRLFKDPLAPDNANLAENYTHAGVSPGGQYVAYRWQEADETTHLSVLDQVTGRYTRILDTAPERYPVWAPPSISNNGKLVFTTRERLLPQDANDQPDVYLQDLRTGTTTLVSTDETGGATGDAPTDAFSTPRITADGRYVAYRGGTIRRLIFRNLATGSQRTLTNVDGTELGYMPALSRTGRYLAVVGITENGWAGVVRRDQAQDCAGDFGTIEGSGTIYGSPGDDVIYGSPDPDIIYGYGGNDVICGLGGDDTIDGGTGDDAIYGGGGDDRIEGNEGNDVVDGADGADSMNGGYGTDAVLYGSATAGVDVSLSRLTPNGMPGEGDQVFNDFEAIFGSAFNDTLSGRENREWLFGQDGSDTLLGMAGDDQLYGGDGEKDVLVGMVGDDYLDGGPRFLNSCAGGPGTNTFDQCTYISGQS